MKRQLLAAFKVTNLTVAGAKAHASEYAAKRAEDELWAAGWELRLAKRQPEDLNLHKFEVWGDFNYDLIRERLARSQSKFKMPFKEFGGGIDAK